MKWTNVKKIHAKILTEDNEEIEIIKSLANVEIVVPRSGVQHKFIMSVITKTLKICPQFKAFKKRDVNEFLLAFKTWAKLYDLVEYPWGIEKDLYSISFDKMDQVEFQDVGKRIIDFSFLLLSYGPVEHIDTLDNYIKQVEYEYNCRVNR
jgi:hypothetical protein